MVDLVTIVFFGVGIALVIYSQRVVARAHQSQYWPSTSGTVTRSEVVSARRYGQSGYEARIEYTYEVDREYQSRVLCIGGTVAMTRKRARERCERYPAGSQVEVFYDPSNPATACLERTAEGAKFMTLVGCGLLVVAVLSLLGVIQFGG
jgi:hypothetical protein